MARGAGRIGLLSARGPWAPRVWLSPRPGPGDRRLSVPARLRIDARLGALGGRAQSLGARSEGRRSCGPRDPRAARAALARAGAMALGHGGRGHCRSSCAPFRRNPRFARIFGQGFAWSAAAQRGIDGRSIAHADRIGLAGLRRDLPRPALLAAC